MAASTFTNAAGGTWDVGTNWTPNGVPGTDNSNDALINSPGTYTVTMDDIESPNSITLNDPAATLTVTSSGEVLTNNIVLDAGTFALAGDIDGGTVTAAGALFKPTSGATLDGVTWLGQLVGGGTTAAYVLDIKDGITLLNAAGNGPGTLEYGSLYIVDVVDAATLDNMIIQFDSINAEYLNGSNASALVFGPNLVVQETAADNLGPQIGGLELENFGTINAASSFGSMLIGSTTFENSGTLAITNREHVSVSSSFTNTAAGTVTVNGGGTLMLGTSNAQVNDATITVSNASTLVDAGNMGGTGAITLTNHAVADVHDLGGSVIFLDGKGTLDLRSPASFTADIGGFQKGDTIDLVGQAVTGQPQYSTDTGVVTVMNGATVVATLDVGGNYGAETFSYQPDPGTGTDLLVACYAEGTRLLTTAGEVAVEALCIGDRLPALLGGGLARVRWIGHRRIDCGRHPTPHDVWPVRVQAGAFGVATPHRDLWLSPDHAVLIDGGLIPIRYLVNGTTVAQVETAKISYWHVELDRHDIVLAEGVAAESFLDTGNRGAFENGGAVVQAHPDFALRVWRTAACAPLVVSGPVLATAKARLRDRVEALAGCLTADPNLRLLVDGRAVLPDVEGSTYRFALPDGAREIRLVSRSTTPAAMSAESADHRRVGVAVAELRVDGMAVPAGDPRRAGGWYEGEDQWQWTNGDAGLACTGARRVEVTLRLFLSYWDTEAGRLTA